MENKPVKQNYPLGMIFILLLVGIGALSALSTMFKMPLIQFGPYFVGGVVAVIFHLIITGILVAVFYGIIKRFGWARKLAIVWYIVGLALQVVNIVSFLGNKTMYDKYYQKLFSPEAYALMTPELLSVSMIVSLIYSLIIGLIIIIYLARKRSFFSN